MVLFNQSWIPNADTDKLLSGLTTTKQTNTGLLSFQSDFYSADNQEMEAKERHHLHFRRACLA